MNRPKQAVVLSPEAWDALPTNKHQLSRRLGELRDVLYVDVHGQSIPTLLKERRLRLPEQVATGVWCATPPTIPQRWLERSPRALRLNAYLSNLFVRYCLHKLGWRNPAVLVYFPPAVLGIRLLHPSFVLYHCVDHYPSFPAWSRQTSFFLAADEKAVRRADAVVATSPALRRHCERWRADVIFLGNVANVELFSSAAHESRNEAAEDFPTVFFHGALSSHKIDFSLLHALVRKVDLGRLTLVGPIIDPEAQREVDRLIQDARVQHIGQVEQSSLIPLLLNADVLLLPYVVSQHTEHVFPLKLIEYLATGIPIVATALPSIAEFAGLEIAYLDSNSLRTDSLRVDPGQEARKRRMTLAAGQTWEQRLEDILTIIDEKTPDRSR